MFFGIVIGIDTFKRCSTLVEEYSMVRVQTLLPYLGGANKVERNGFLFFY